MLEKSLDDFFREYFERRAGYQRLNTNEMNAPTFAPAQNNWVNASMAYNVFGRTSASTILAQSTIQSFQPYHHVDVLDGYQHYYANFPTQEGDSQALGGYHEEEDVQPAQHKTPPVVWWNREDNIARFDPTSPFPASGHAESPVQQQKRPYPGQRNSGNTTDEDPELNLDEKVPLPKKRRFVCDVEGCSATFAYKHDIGRHKKNVHEGVGRQDPKQRFYCGFKSCKSSFSRKHDLGKHKRSKHGI